jgi:hypothetical protein
MKRKILIAVLALGTIVGYGSAIARMRCGHGGWHERRAAYERRVADICTDAALRARADRPATGQP